VYRVQTRALRFRIRIAQGEWTLVDEALAESGSLRGHEITRFKGLGEISPKEFGQFIGSDIRMAPVAVNGIGEIGRCLDFFMGKNTPERRTFIVDNLVTEVV
jgi:topoisomerase-4 subunit B